MVAAAVLRILYRVGSWLVTGLAPLAGSLNLKWGFSVGLSPHFCLAIYEKTQSVLLLWQTCLISAPLVFLWVILPETLILGC